MAPHLKGSEESAKKISYLFEILEAVGEGRTKPTKSVDRSQEDHCKKPLTTPLDKRRSSRGYWQSLKFE